MDLFLTILNHGGAAVLLVAIFGVSMASFALRQGRWERGPELDTESDALPWVWWQDLQELGFEVHLKNGETWRSLGRFEPTIWHRKRGGPTRLKLVADDTMDERLTECLRTIKGGRAGDRHAHCLVAWSALDHGYQLKLLNDSVWQFNSKSEGLGENNELAWHRIDSPAGMVFESMNSIHTSLNDHLRNIRSHEALEPSALAGEGGSGAITVTVANWDTGGSAPRPTCTAPAGTATKCDPSTRTACVGGAGEAALGRPGGAVREEGQ